MLRLALKLWGRHFLLDKLGWPASCTYRGLTPQSFSLCGVCLDGNSPILLSFPARHFQYLNKDDVPIVEALE
jgi:hypothetical protein